MSDVRIYVSKCIDLGSSYSKAFIIYYIYRNGSNEPTIKRVPVEVDKKDYYHAENGLYELMSDFYIEKKEEPDENGDDYEFTVGQEVSRRENSSSRNSVSGSFTKIYLQENRRVPNLPTIAETQVKRKVFEEKKDFFKWYPFIQIGDEEKNLCDVARWIYEKLFNLLETKNREEKRKIVGEYGMDGNDSSIFKEYVSITVPNDSTPTYMAIIEFIVNDADIDLGLTDPESGRKVYSSIGDICEDYMFMTESNALLGVYNAIEKVETNLLSDVIQVLLIDNGSYSIDISLFEKQNRGGGEDGEGQDNNNNNNSVWEEQKSLGGGGCGGIYFTNHIIEFLLGQINGMSWEVYKNLMKGHEESSRKRNFRKMFKDVEMAKIRIIKHLDELFRKDIELFSSETDLQRDPDDVFDSHFLDRREVIDISIPENGRMIQNTVYFSPRDLLDVYYNEFREGEKVRNDFLKDPFVTRGREFERIPVRAGQILTVFSGGSSLNPLFRKACYNKLGYEEDQVRRNELLMRQMKEYFMSKKDGFNYNLLVAQGACHLLRRKFHFDHDYSVSINNNNREFVRRRVRDDGLSFRFTIGTIMKDRRNQPVVRNTPITGHLLDHLRTKNEVWWRMDDETNPDRLQDFYQDISCSSTTTTTTTNENEGFFPFKIFGPYPLIPNKPEVVHFFISLLQEPSLGWKNHYEINQFKIPYFSISFTNNLARQKCRDPEDMDAGEGHFRRYWGQVESKLRDGSGKYDPTEHFYLLLEQDERGRLIFDVMFWDCLRDNLSDGVDPRKRRPRYSYGRVSGIRMSKRYVRRRSGDGTSFKNYDKAEEFEEIGIGRGREGENYEFDFEMFNYKAGYKHQDERSEWITEAPPIIMEDEDQSSSSSTTTTTRRRRRKMVMDMGLDHKFGSSGKQILSQLKNESNNNNNNDSNNQSTRRKRYRRKDTTRREQNEPKERIFIDLTMTSDEEADRIKIDSNLGGRKHSRESSENYGGKKDKNEDVDEPPLKKRKIVKKKKKKKKKKRKKKKKKKKERRKKSGRRRRRKLTKDELDDGEETEKYYEDGEEDEDEDDDESEDDVIEEEEEEDEEESDDLDEFLEDEDSEEEDGRRRKKKKKKKKKKKRKKRKKRRRYEFSDSDSD